MTRRVLGALAGLLLLAGCASSASPKPKPSDLNAGSSGPFLGVGLTPPEPRPQFTMTDTSGKPFEFGTTTAKHPTMLYFGYTQCPDICPETMADARLALTRIAPAVARSTYVVFVSTDVKHDTAPVLSRWLSNFSAGTAAHWVGLRGTQAQVDAAQAAAHVQVAEDGGQTHSAQVLLYGPDDYAHVTFLQSSNEQQQIAHDLPLVARGTT